LQTSAEDRLSSELAEPLDRPMARRIFVQVHPDTVAIVDVGRKDPAQLGLAEDDDVIEGIPGGSSRSVSPHARSAKATSRLSGDRVCPWLQDAS
jgi:hypothetical protein